VGELKGGDSRGFILLPLGLTSHFESTKGVAVGDSVHARDVQFTSGLLAPDPPSLMGPLILITD
jgi:hypothetical protein